ncbi:MAG: galactose mutarotase [Pirellulaceae bacterium]|nr:galactose mutarotase [Pirellulaceae bacterium]
MQIDRSNYGSTPDGQEVELFSISNSSGWMVQLTNFGAILTSVVVPDRDGTLGNITLGFDSLASYLQRHPFFGATVGRFCNRIAAGKFELDGKVYQLSVNKPPNHIHGGQIGFDKRVWRAETVAPDARTAGVRLSLTSPDGEEGYPGTVQATAEYLWDEAGQLTCTFRATSDQPTVINMTNHAYWNLAGAGNGDIRQHLLQLAASQYLEVDETLIPTGAIVGVADTPLDFRQFHAIGERLDQLPATKGYDHCFVVDGQPGSMRRCARAIDPQSGRSLEVLTTQPGVQLYTGNHLTGAFASHAGFCLETQHYPDSPNKPHFPSTRLVPGQVFEQVTVYRFGIAQSVSQ